MKDNLEKILIYTSVPSAPNWVSLVNAIASGLCSAGWGQAHSLKQLIFFSPPPAPKYIKKKKESACWQLTWPMQ